MKNSSLNLDKLCYYSKTHRYSYILRRIKQGCSKWYFYFLRGKDVSHLQNRIYCLCDTHSLLFCGCRDFCPTVKRPGLEVDHLTPYRVEVKNERSHTSTPPACPYGVDKGNFTLIFVPINLCQI